MTTVYKKLPKDETGRDIAGVIRIQDSCSFGFNLLNSDYQRMLEELKNGEAVIQKWDGNQLTEEETKQFIATLP